MHKKLIQTFTLLLLLLTQARSVFAYAAMPADVSISVSNNKTEWLNSVCQHATPGGCEYFRAHEAEPAWFALKNMNATGITIRFQREVTAFTDSLALWQMEVTITTVVGVSETHTAYATISNQNGQAQLDRIIVFDHTLIALLE